MNLLKDKWLPRVSQGKIERISLDEAMDLPLHELRIGRPDFDMALLLFAIGVKQCDYSPLPGYSYHERFLQSDEARDRGREKRIGLLLIDEPGENAVKHNKDIFLRGANRDQLCRCCAIQGLYSLSQFSSAKGPGFYPGNLFHNAVYIRLGDTLRDTVEMNLLDKHVPDSAYFSVPNLYWLGDEDDHGECAICHTKGPLITTFMTKSAGEKPDPHPSPHCAKTLNGKRLAMGHNNTKIDFINGCALDANHAIPPEVIQERGSLGDSVQVFSTYYDKALLTHLVMERLTLQESIDKSVLARTVSAIWKMKYRDSTPVDYLSSFATGIWATLSDRILMERRDTLDACLSVYKEFCPKPHFNDKRYGKWKHGLNTVKYEPKEEADVQN